MLRSRLLTNLSAFSKLSLKKYSKRLQNDDKIGMLITIEDTPGSLLSVLSILREHDVNLSFISSKPSFNYSKTNKKVDIFLDVENKDQTELMNALKKINQTGSIVKFNNVTNVPWFPKNFLDLNLMGNDLKIGGEHLSSDHPGFNDPVYKVRRTQIEQKSAEFQFGLDNTVPIIEYTKEENELWSTMWDKLYGLIRQHACEEFNSNFDVLIAEKIFTKNKIPQIQEFNEFYANKTGWFLRPTGGLLSERDFLNTLAFKVFPCTQYIRHASMPLYTPEPDLIHEFLGHASMFINQEFVDFSQQIGLASLGASDEDIIKLGKIYWYTIEFGILEERGKRKIYGGGILSSPSEIEYAMSDKPHIYPFDLNAMSVHHVDITSIQEGYYIAPSFKEMVTQVKEFSEKKMPKDFNVRYNLDSKCIDVDRRITI